MPDALWCQNSVSVYRHYQQVKCTSDLRAHAFLHFWRIFKSLCFHMFYLCPSPLLDECFTLSVHLLYFFTALWYFLFLWTVFWMSSPLCSSSLKFCSFYFYINYVLCFILMTSFFILVYLNNLFYYLNLFLRIFKFCYLLSLKGVIFPFSLENLKHLYF